MAETIKLFGKPVPKNVVIVGGAIAAGVVGYAWFKQGTGGEELPSGALPEPVPEPTDTPGFEVLGTAPAPMTNAEWTQLAVERLINIGIDGPGVSAAIGKFLARKPLNTTEQSLVQQALAHAGQPPVGGPYVVIPEVSGAVITPPPPPPPPPPPANNPPPVSTKPYASDHDIPAVTGFSAVGGNNVAHLTWQAVPHADGYEIARLDAGQGGGTGWQAVGMRTSYDAPTQVGSPTRYGFAIRPFVPGVGYGTRHTHSNVITVFP